jgi:signal transduction histidine kinase/uncharacterized membrane protein
VTRRAETSPGSPQGDIHLDSSTWQRERADWQLVGCDQNTPAFTQGGITRRLGVMASEFYRHRPDIVADMDRCLAEERAIKRETRYDFSGTGGSRHLTLTYVPVLSANTACPPRLLLLTEDITDEVQAELSLQAAWEAAETARREEEARRREAERRRRIAESLGAILAALNSDRSLEEILDLIAARARRLLDTQAVGIYRLESEAGKWAVEASRGLLVTYVAGSNVPVGQDTLRQAIVTRRPVTGLETGAARSASQGVRPADSGLPRERTNPRAAGSSWPGWYKAWLAVPIVTKDQVFGGMLLYYAEPRTCSEEEVQLAVAFSDQAALAIENARLHQRIEQVAAAAERERLARDLHDVVIQTLFSASVIAETLPRIWASNPRAVKSGIEELGHLTRGALAEMRTLLVELRPGTLIEKPLGELLQHLVDAVSSQARIPVALTIEGDSLLPPDLQVTLYRIAQESLNNVWKYARARQATVSLHCTPESVWLAVTDDGCGFETNLVAPDAMGLSIMRERAAEIQAAFHVKSRPGGAPACASTGPSMGNKRRVSTWRHSRQVHLRGEHGTGAQPITGATACSLPSPNRRNNMNEIATGYKVEALDGYASAVGELVLDPDGGEVTHFSLKEGHLWGQREVMLPLSTVDRVAGDTVYLKLDKQAIGQLPAIPVRRGERAKIDLVAVAFDAPEDAARALGFIEEFRKRGTLKILNAAVLVRDAEGNITVQDTRDIDPEKGRLLGAVTGGLIGLVGGPVGAVVGAGAGGLAGKKIDFGFSEKFLDGLKQYLKPDTSALIVLVEHGYYEQLSEVIDEEEGVFFRQTLTDRLVEQLLAEGE